MIFSNVIDTPRKAGGEDLLGIDRYVNALAEFINIARMPTTLAIQGEWGSGKTSLMNQVRYLLCDNPNNQENSDNSNNSDNKKYFHGLWIDTWQYSLMSTPEKTMFDILKGITDEILNIIKITHKSKLSNTIDKVGNLLSVFAKVSAKTTLSLSGVNSTIVDDIYSSYSTENNLSVFRKSLSDAINSCLEEDRKSGNPKKGFLFFIDDLDRLEPSTSVQILELLKNIFEIDNCIFILSIDYEVVVKGLIPKYGQLTVHNERQFRSFFDKIIQLPFSMPISSYKIDTYLSNSLCEIGYFSVDELNQSIGSNNSIVKEIITEMALFSTGTNPRSLKRLINSLSLIKIMHNITLQENELTLMDKLLNFGLVCIQISYPEIYNMLLSEPNFENWTERTAIRLHLPQITDDELETISINEEFDEVWEQILYRSCKKASYLSTHSYDISKLLNSLRDIINDSKQLGETIERIIKFSSVTTVTSEKSTIKKYPPRIRLNSYDEFFNVSKERGYEQNVLDMVSTLIDNIKNIYENLIRLEFSPSGIAVNVVNKKSRMGLLLKIDLRKKGLFLFTKKYGPFYVTNVNRDEPGGLPSNFYEDMFKRFKSISTDRISSAKRTMYTASEQSPDSEQSSDSSPSTDSEPIIE